VNYFEVLISEGLVAVIKQEMMVSF